MRTIKRIFIHCTAGNQTNYTDEGLVKFFKNKGWKAPGYHYVIRPDGTIFNMWPEEKLSNGVSNYNSTSINIAWVGGVTKEKPKGTDNRTREQIEALHDLCEQLRVKYPKAYIMGHRDISPDLNHNGKVDTWEYIKMCPCFNAMEEFAYLNMGLTKPDNSDY